MSESRSQAPAGPASHRPGSSVWWVLVGCGLAAIAGVLVAYRSRFDWSLQLGDIPALPLAIGLVAAGFVYLAVLPLVRGSGCEPDGAASQRWRLAWVVAVGLVLRLMMFATEPALEDDQQRYLWEGALVANGFSPYALAPADAWAAAADSTLSRLAVASTPVLERVNHPLLKTIYPPVAQASFALAYMLKPFSLTAWRLVLLAADIATLVLLMTALERIGRSRLWVALYWWNPIVIKEIFNSGHMDGLLPPLLLGALLLADRRRPLLATGLLGLAAGVKVWPVLLLPLVLRPFIASPRILVACGTLMAMLSGLWLAPILAGGLDARSGFLAYAGDWQANSALLPALRDGIGWVFAGWGIGHGTAGRIARGLLAFSAAMAAFAVARRPVTQPADLLRRAADMTLLLLLVSPAQFPWYAVWTLPFAVFVPRLGVLALAVTMPLYYVSFHMSALGLYDLYRDRVVWVVWIPIWLLLLRDHRIQRRYEAAGTVAPGDGKGGEQSHA